MLFKKITFIAWLLSIFTPAFNPPEALYDIIQGLKYQWRIKHPDEKAIKEISTTHNLSTPIAHVLFSRGCITTKDINSYLSSSYERDVYPASTMKDSVIAADRILKAIENKERILIFGDYDVDGVTATSLMLLALIPLGANVDFYLPNRVTDGYGLSAKAVRKAVEDGYHLIVTVDNGITAFEAGQEAKALGIDLIITDHHRQHDDLPSALVIINPNQHDCFYPFKELAGVGVIFKLMSLIYNRLNKELPEKVYELLLLGTIADVVPLLGENRYWVKHGLIIINKNRSVALKTLLENNNVTKPILTSLDIGFMITPQINALGRLDDPREAVTFLTSSDASETKRIGAILKKMNEDRKLIDQAIFDEVQAAIANNSIDLKNENIIMAAHDQWPAGVVGLVAGKIAHHYGRPTFLFHTNSATGFLTGSCRSIPEFNVFEALNGCKEILLSFGGHSSAAGMTLKEENAYRFKEHLEQCVATHVAPENLVPKITLDATLELDQVTGVLVADMELLEPFGCQNAQPLFLIKNVRLASPPSLLKDKHVKATISYDGVQKNVTFFNRYDIFKKLWSLGDKPFHIAATVVSNEWQGISRIELQGIDIAIK